MMSTSSTASRNDCVHAYALARSRSAFMSSGRLYTGGGVSELACVAYV